MIQAAHFDIKTVTGLRQALVLSAEYENEPFPLEGYTLHGSIGTYPRMDLKCSVDENGRARIEWDSVPPGNWKYDVFLISASNDETPLMEGTFTALPRITPVLDDESVNDEVGGVLHLPSGNEGTITLEVDGGFVSKEYATIAKDAADKAQQALAAIPQVDASGNMTLAGGLTAAGAINANGGINIPLAVGAPANESGVNRLYAAGMGGAANTYTAGAFLNTDSLTTTGTATVTKTVPWQMARIGIPAGSHTTIQAPFEGPSSQWNYSSWAGFSFVWRATAAAKVTMGIGRGAKTIRTDLTTDSYTIIPGNGLAFNSGEILDITFDNVRDTARNGYTVRVREIYALNSTDGWQVKTTTSFIPATQNEPIPWTVCKIIYQQQAVANSSVYENLGGLWLMVTGAQTNNLYKIATCRGVSNFETGVGVSRWVTDVINITSGTASVYAGPGEYAYYQPRNINPLFYGLDAIGTNAVESEETAAFEDINVPIEES